MRQDWLKKIMSIKRAKKQREYYLLIYLWATIIFSEFVLRLNTDFKFFNGGLWYIFLFSGVVSAFIFFLLSFFKRARRNILAGIFLFLTSLIFTSQLIYYKIFKVFFTYYSAQNSAQVIGFLKDILIALKKNIFWILIFFAPFIAFVTFRRHFKKTSSLMFKKQRKELPLIFAGALFGLAIVSLHLGDREVNSSYNLYYQNNYLPASVNRLGLVSSMRLDLQRSLVGFEPEFATLPGEEPSSPGNLGELGFEPDRTTPTSSRKPLDQTGQGHETENGSSNPSDQLQGPPIHYADQVMDINFEEIIKNTTDEKLKEMHHYFSQRKPTKKNKMTGRFKGYNLILITAESYADFAIDPDLTPTLYKMTEEGFKFTNFYNPIWGVSTSDGEYVANTGLIPKSGVWSLYKSGSIDMPFAMGNQLKGLGYSTRAYHNHTYDYYKRNVSHPNLGYDYKGLGSGLEVRATWPESDLEMMELTVPEYKADLPFHTYYMTVSGHMQYDWDGNFIASKNKSLVQNLPYSEAGKGYLATQIELDKALEYLLAELEAAGVLDQTLIGMSADHYPYGLELSEISELRGHKVEENFELYKSSFILYNSKMEPMTLDRPVSSLDIIPTISNLMDLSFDSRLMMGIDMFSDQAPLVIFDNRSFITDLGRYNSKSRTFTLEPGVSMTDQEKKDYRRFISNEMERQFYYSARILDTDYYSLVVPKE